MAVGVVNQCPSEMIGLGYLRVVNPDVRPFAYKLTPRGTSYRRRLRHEHYRSVLGSFRAVEERMRSRLDELKRRGVCRVVFYGAGEVMEIALPLAQTVGLEVLGLVDDDSTKHGAIKNGLLIQGPRAIGFLEPDAVLISTFRHAREIRRKIDRALRGSVHVWEL